MNRTLFAIALVAPTFCLAQQPNTPGMSYDSQFREVFFGPTMDVRLMLAPGATAPETDPIRDTLRHLSAPVAGGAVRGAFFLQAPVQQENERAIRLPLASGLNTDPQFVFPDLWTRALREAATSPGDARRGRGGGGGGGRGGNGFAGGRGGPPSPARALFEDLIRPEMTKIDSELVQQLRTLLRSEPAMSAEDRAKRTAELQQQIRAIEARMNALDALNAAQPDAAKRLAERVRQLYDQEQGLQMRLTALRARREALQAGLKELQVQAEAQRRNDPVADEMQKIVDLQQAKLLRIRQNAAQGVMSTTEVAQAEAEVAETRLRLLEHQAAIGKGGKGELMDRLTDELAMVSIDNTDVQIQLSQLHEQIARTDPAKLNADALNDLLKREPALDPAGGSKVPPLYHELEQQVADLRLEWLKLVVDDVELVETPAAAQ